MSDHLSGLADSKELVAEIARLRAIIRTLEERVVQLDELAHQDPLIPLPNRRGFMIELDRIIDRVRRYGDQAAMLFVDINGLKAINDSLGHPAGDEALIQVAELLAGGVRKSDCAARIGGDEFGILLERADQASAAETAYRLAERIAASEFRYDGHELKLGVAVGVALIEAGDTADDVILRADRAMYRQKSAA